MKAFLKYFFCLLLFLYSCKKEGPGGDSSISFFVKHHNEIIPGATVYIKYGAKEFPGADLSKYDDFITTDYAGHHKGRSHFDGLRKGDYFLYAVGYDSTMAVAGGIPVKIKTNGETVEATVQVTEEEH